MSRVRIAFAQSSALALLLMSGSAAFAQGTSLSMNVSAVAAACVSGTSDVTVSYTVTSTGAADSATVGYSIDAGAGPGAVVGLTTIASGTEGVGAWTKGAGSTKTATGQFIVPLANGEYDIEVCAEQNGNGNDNKSDCSTAHVQVACTQVDGCDQAAVLFGEVTGNKNLCQSEARINVQVKGLFGQNASLEVKDGSSSSVAIASTSRNGDSCVYHWNLDPKTWSAVNPGLYTFTVLGDNGASFPFAATLVCSKPGRK